MSASDRPAATTLVRDSRRPGINSRSGSIVNVTRSSELIPRRWSSAAISPAVTSITLGFAAILFILRCNRRSLHPAGHFLDGHRLPRLHRDCIITQKNFLVKIILAEREGGNEPRRTPQASFAAGAMTTRSPKPSTAFTRPRSSVGADPGNRWRPSSSRPSNGSIGSTTDASWSPSETSRQPRPNNGISPCWTR